MTDFQEIVIDGSQYTIALPNKDTDYIQRKISEEAVPYEIGMLRDMARRLTHGDLVLDVGANIGNHSLYLATVAGCQVHAFEPNTELCKAIDASVASNKLESKIVIHCAGVGKEPAKAHFICADESNLGAQSLAVGDGEHDVIEIVRLDDSNFERRVAAIKIDVEGMELAVLEGAVELIKRDSPKLYIECQTEQDFKEVQEWVSCYGYSYWDSFNATPTHLFVDASSVTNAQRIEHLMAKVVRNEYQLESQVRELRVSLDRANKKYRDANVRIDTLKGKRNDLLVSNERGEAQRRLLEERVTSASDKNEFLTAELKKSEAKLKKSATELSEERDRASRLMQQLDAANQKYRLVTARLDAIRHSRALLAVKYIRRVLRLRGSVTKLSLRFLGWGRQLVTPRTVPAAVQSVGVPAQSAEIPFWVMSPDRDGELKQTALRDLRVACIMDNFTFNSYLPECDLYNLTPQNWGKELEGCQPHMLFIESAWRGKDELWGSRVGHASDELQGIVHWCRERNIPTVFWNKEDPVHFETFLNTARLFDFVFTTDIDCIHRYKAALQHNRVYLLPFACQPRVNNPIEKYDRKDAFCFAGAYYVRYPERTQDLENFVKQLSAYRPLEIYDRNHGKDHPDYQFPEAYRPYIVGSLPFEEIDKAYKGYRYAINLNSIKQSQTMFARRICELLASNTITVSNFSRSVRLLFGDLVVTSDDGAELIRRLESLAGDDRNLRKLRLAGMRKVMKEHTCQDRLAYVLAKIKNDPVPDLMPGVLVVGYAETHKQLRMLLSQFEHQTYSNKHLLVVTADNLKLDNESDTECLRTVSVAEVGDCPLEEWSEGYDWVAGMVAEDYYGRNYLTDLALATRYSDADVIGKPAHYAWTEAGLKLIDGNAEYRTASDVQSRSAMLRTRCLVGRSLYHFVVGLPEDVNRNVLAQAVDAFNYCKGGMTEGADRSAIESAADDLSGLNEGMPLSELISRAERIAPEAKVEGEAPVISGDRLAAYFKPPVRKDYRLIVVGNRWEVESSLPDGKHDYLYAARDITPGELGYDTHAKLHLDVTPGLNLQIVLMFLGKDKKRISAEVCPANRNHEIQIPARAKFIRFGLRIYSSGSAAINGLVLGHRQLRPAEVLGRSKYLLLTNHYASYDDLYRNGFVHSRVKAYQERGVNVDVFRLRKDEPLGYHEFQNVDVVTGSQEALHKLLTAGNYQHILVHFLDADMWKVLGEYIDRVKVTVWVHGAEIHPWYRRRANFDTTEQENEAKRLSENRMTFWRSLLKPMPKNLKLVFVSKSFSEEVMKDLGFRIPEEQCTIIHNPVDTELFSYLPKSMEQRKKILSIRPFASRIYANDLSVEVIRLLSKEPFFDELEFRIVGKGKLFKETVAPLRDYSNVTLEECFLRREEIAELHKEYGIFLCGSRMDTQGVSRDEAMSSGLVPVTNAIAAIPEFVDQNCGVLAPAEDAKAMADGIAMLVKNPERFEAMSNSAAAHVRRKSCKSRILEQELYQFVESYFGLDCREALVEDSVE